MEKEDPIILKDFLSELIKERRSMTAMNFNRYIFILNKVIEHGGRSMIELKGDIKQGLEKNEAAEIDKKTLKRIITNLAAEGLVKTFDFLVTIQSESNVKHEHVKTIVAAPHLDEDDPRI